MGEWVMGLGWAQLLGVCALFFVVLTAGSNALGFVLERMFQQRGLRIFAVPLRRNQIRKELLGNVVFLAIFVPALTAVIASGLVRFTSGWVAEVTTFGVSWVAFVVFYYFFHRALHARSLFWIHRWHHESLVTTPAAGLSMSPLEAVGWFVGLVGPGLVLAQAGLLGVWGWLAFFVVHFAGNIIGHANAELFPMSARPAITLFSNVVTYHAMHHARFDGHYGFASAILDRLLGTEWPDWLELVERVKRGTPLTSLRERGESATKR